MSLPQLPPQVPQVKSAWRRTLGSIGLRALGWRIEGNLPDLPKFVLIVAPHTSNRDFFVGFIVYLALQLETLWFAKHTALRGPIGALGRYFGAVAIDRARAGNVVPAYIEEFARRERMVLTLTPEGTRRRVAEWKMGFHRVALGAGVPIVPAALDYSARCVRFGPPLTPCSDYLADLRTLKRFFAAHMAYFPDQYDASLP